MLYGDPEVMRYAYIKNGDVIGQLRRLRQCSGPVGSGPDAFLDSFMRNVGDDALLLVGHGASNATEQHGTVDAVVIGDGGGRILKMFRRVRGSAVLLGRLLTFRPDRIICGRVGGMLWMSTIAAVILGVPLVHSRHNRLIDPKARWYGRLRAIIDIWCIKKACGVVCHGPFLVSELQRIGGLQRPAIEFDLNRLVAERRGQSVVHTETVQEHRILYAGRIEANKGVFDLMHAAREFLRMGMASLTYAGTGTALEALQRRARELAIDGQVAFAGQLEQNALGALMVSSIVVVTPTRPEFPEGRCMVAMEALVYGVPVIAPKFGPFPFLVRHGENGILFEPGDSRSLRDALRTVLCDTEAMERLKRGAAKGISTGPNVPSFGDAVMTAFSNTAGTRMRAAVGRHHVK